MGASNVPQQAGGPALLILGLVRMSLTALVMTLLVVVTLLIGAGVLALLHRPAWSAPLASAFTAMMFMAAVVGLLVTVTRS